MFYNSRLLGLRQVDIASYDKMSTVVIIADIKIGELMVFQCKSLEHLDVNV